MPDRLAMGALADSYYEYLLKQWLQSPAETNHRDAWLAVMDALPSLVVPDPRSEGSGNSKLQLMEMNRQGGLMWKMDHLSCFVPGMIALGLRHMSDDELLQNSRNETWHRMAAGLTSTCAHLWMDTKSGLAPEFVFFDRMKSGEKTIPRGAQHSYLRPETAESLFYLYRMTGQTRYRKWGKKLFRSIVEHSKVAGGYGSVEDVTVVPTKKMDEMQSFVMAETFKYLYLLFSPNEARAGVQALNPKP
ncbi:MNS3 [Symbiodinium microadriaticum]|nr:MNS3 [Symbiodinium microadriaticum]